MMKSVFRPSNPVRIADMTSICPQRMNTYHHRLTLTHFCRFLGNQLELIIFSGGDDLKALNNQPVIAHPVAKIISMITNPAILSIIMLFIILFTKSDRLSAAAAQSIALIGLLVILPLVFVFLRTASLLDKKIYRTDPTLFLKRHPLDIMILGIVCGSSSLVVLKLLSARPRC